MSPGDGWGGYIDEEWLGRAREPILEPDIPIIDPHHHLWNWPFKYEIAETMADLGASHNVRATVHVEAHGHYRTDGPEYFRPVGETEYVADVAERTAGTARTPNVCAGIVGH